MLVRAGDGIVLLLILLWLSITVGPWWLGVAIFALGVLVNHFEHNSAEKVIDKKHLKLMEILESLDEKKSQHELTDE